MDVDGVERCIIQRVADVRVREWTLRRSGDIERLVGAICACADLIHERSVAPRRSSLDVEIDPGTRISTTMSKSRGGGVKTRRRALTRRARQCQTAVDHLSHPRTNSISDPRTPVPASQR